MCIRDSVGFAQTDGSPANLRVCRRGEGNGRLLVETALAMLGGVCHLKKMQHRHRAYFKIQLAFRREAFNRSVQWEYLPVDDNGFVLLSIAQFSF